MSEEIGYKRLELSIWGAMGMAFSYIIYTCLAGGITELLFIIVSKIFYWGNNEIAQTIVKILNEIITYALVVLMMLRRVKKAGFSDFRLNYNGKFNYKSMVILIFLMIGYQLWVQNSVVIIIEKIPVPNFVEKEFANLFENPYAGIISITILAPIFEEIIMRGVILEGLMNRYKPATAIIGSALIFGISHFNLPQFLTATMLGLILGIIYYKTKSLFLCITIHMTNNIMVFSYLLSEPSTYLFLFLVGILIFLIAGRMTVKYILRYSEEGGSLSEKAV